MIEPSRNGADLVLSVFLAPLAAGRRVLWLGDDTEAPTRLAQCAARVRVVDPRPPREEASRSGSAVLRDADGEGFELAVLPDVTFLDDLDGTLGRIREALADGGVVVAGVPADHPRAGDLEALLGETFPEVRLLGEAPFAGFALADLSADEVAEVVVDGSLLGQPADVERVYGVASSSLPAIDPYTVVQVAGAASRAVAPTAVDRAAPEDDDALQEALAARSREAAALRDALKRAETRLSQAQARLVATEGELAQARATAQGLSAEEDVDRLEAHLRERGARLRELEAECARRAVLVRDLTEELVEHQLGRRGAPQAHPLDVAAAETQTELERDELRVRVLEQDQALDRLGRENARLAGRARGLAARLAEAQELRGTAEARLRMAELELEQRQDELRALEAKLAETREQLELTMIQARGTNPPGPAGGELVDRLAALEASERRLSARVGELSGQLLAAQDLAAQAMEERDRARAETLRLTAQVGNLETRMEGLRIGYEMRIAMLGSETPPHPVTGTDEAIERELRRVSGELEELRGENEGLRLRLADREAALAAAQRHAAGTEVLDEADRLREEIAALRAENGELTLRLADLEELRAKEAARARDLAQALASRDALVTRLQIDLAEEERSHRLFEAQVRRAEDEIARLREAVVEASAAVDAREAAEREVARLQERVAELEERLAGAATVQAQVEALRAQLEEAQERLREASVAAQRDRQTLTEEAERERAALEAELTEARRQRDALAAAQEETLAALREARKLLDAWRAQAESDEGGARSEITAVGMEAPTPEAGVDALERAIADKDTLLRSLTAQLEERDDRIRALERRLAAGGPADGDADTEAMRQMLLELEERAGRLQEELSHERSARAALERQLAEAERHPEQEAELERLRRLVREREDALEQAVARAGGYERDVSSLRGVVAEARSGLEALLGDATTAGDPATAERIGALLSLLSGF